MRARMLALATLYVVAIAGAGDAGAQQAGVDSGTQTTSAEAIGASLVHPEGWIVEREEHTFDETYGFTLWRADSDAPHDHGGTPALRVALAYDLRPEEIEGAVEGRLSELAGLPANRETVAVAEEGHEGVAVGPVPGSTPYTEVYVPVGERVYKINVYLRGPEDAGLDAEDRRLLSGLSFEPPSGAASSLEELPDANAPEALYGAGDPGLAEAEEEVREEGLAEAAGGKAELVAGSRAKVRRYSERRISGGCWRAKSPFFFQTQHGKYANRKRYNRRPGWTRIGQPNFWGQYTHGSAGFGRCSSNYYTNDKFAVDYPLKHGDVVFSPFKRGKVTFAGRNQSHKNYGRFVVIRARNGKYVSMSAHLSGIARGIKRGARVNAGTVIGFAGDTGHRSIPVGPVHLHQAFYRKPRLLRDGSPYGGAGLQTIYHHYVGTAAGTRPGVYEFGPRSRDSIDKSKGDFVSN